MSDSTPYDAGSIFDLFMDPNAPAPTQPRRLTCQVEMDAAVQSVCTMFDYAFDGTSTFDVPTLTPPDDWSVGLIVGPSGSGKSSMLRSFGELCPVPLWDGRAIVSQLGTDFVERLSAVGLNSIPSWVRPYSALSTGQKFRADLARCLQDGALLDEFTSSVDRVVAASTSCAMRRYIDRKGLRRIVVATCHRDVAEWLCPDWVFDTGGGELRVGRAARAPIAFELEPCSADEWRLFSPHHYLDGSLNRSARCWLALWRGVPVGFASALAFPNGNFRDAWREHRTVVLPDYQGLGIGPRLSDAVADLFVQSGCRYFSKTSHPRLGGYREFSPLWKATSKNHRARLDYKGDHAYATKEDGHKLAHAQRVCFSHERVRPALSEPDVREPVHPILDLFLEAVSE